MSKNAVAQELLSIIRNHPGRDALMEEVERPRITPFRASEADQSEKARAKWIYESGKLYQHEQWLTLLTGKQASEQETK